MALTERGGEQLVDHREGRRHLRLGAGHAQLLARLARARRRGQVLVVDLDEGAGGVAQPPDGRAAWRGVGAVRTRLDPAAVPPGERAPGPMSRLTCDFANISVTATAAEPGTSCCWPPPGGSAAPALGGSALLLAVLPGREPPPVTDVAIAARQSLAAWIWASLPLRETTCMPHTLSLLTTTLAPVDSRIDFMVDPPGPIILPHVSRS